MKINLTGVPKEAILDANKVNNGIWVHLESSEVDPDTGETYPLYLDANTAYPQRALVRYYRCQRIKQAEEAKQKQAMTKMRAAPKKEKEKVAVENSILPEKERFGLVLVAFENVGAEPGIQYVDPEDAAEIFGMSEYEGWVQQIRDVSMEDAKYAATSDTEAGNASPPTTSEAPAAETTKTTSQPVNEPA